MDMVCVAWQDGNAAVELSPGVPQLCELEITCYAALNVQCDGIGRWHGLDVAEIDSMVMGTVKRHVA